MTSPAAPRNLRTKLVEAFRALQLERLRTKQQILELYLNLAPYSGNHRGVESGSLALFGKHADQLSRDEAYLLAGLPQSPTRYAPRQHAARALARRERVLQAGVRAGHMDAASAQRTGATALRLQSAARPDRAPHFSRLALGLRPAGGRSTLDLELQTRVESEVARHAMRLPAGADIAVCVLEIESGALCALVGSADVHDPVDGEVNGASAWRSPGSALKPFLYAAAFEAHILDANSLLNDAPIQLAGWSPRNFDGEFSGNVEVREALRRSLNIPAILAAKRTGLARVIALLEGSGLHFRGPAAQRAGLGLATGAAEVRLLDLTNAYATLGRNGLFVKPRLFEDQEREQQRVISEASCASLHEILGAEQRLPAGSLERRDFCWKTGTSSGFRDAWALGHNERFAIGVWCGYFSGSGDRSFVGSTAAAPLLFELFQL